MQGGKEESHGQDVFWATVFVFKKTRFPVVDTGAVILSAYKV